MEDPSRTAQKIATDILANPKYRRSGELDNQLLDALHRGGSLDTLLPLLSSKNDEIVLTGIWVASELGAKGAPLLRAVVPLLEHPFNKVRIFAVDALLIWAGPNDGQDLAKVVLMLGDNESLVRKKVMDFLSRASIEQLSAARSYLTNAENNSPYVTKLRWIENVPDHAEVSAALHSDNPLTREFGAIAATRAARLNKTNMNLLLEAGSSGDSDVEDFASMEHNLLSET